jgi:hypothetical protein
MKFKHFETESGQTHQVAQFDGYSIGERLLEGVTFQITIQEDGTLSASVIDRDKNYFSQFNQELWLSKAVEYAKNTDILSTLDGNECYLVSEDSTETNNTKTPVPITISKIEDILNGLNKEEETEETQEGEKELVIGKFKPKRKFLNFVQGRKGGIRYHNNTALIEGKQLSGMLDDVYFKVTICDEGTINFEEVGTNQTNDEMIQRFIDDIDSRDVTGYMKKYVVYGIDFKDEDGKKMYLEVEEVRPIDKLFSLFDEIDNTETEEKEEPKVSQSGLSILDSLFSDDEEENSVQEDSVKVEEKQTLTFAQQMIADAFENMNKEKVEELQDRIEKKESEMRKFEMTYKSAEKSFENCKHELRVLNTRLDDMKPKSQPNGIVFYVSPENKTGLQETDDNVKLVVNKISEALKLKEDVVLELVTQGFYTIKFAGKGNLEDFENFEITKETLMSVNKLKPFGKITMVGNAEFEFRGELNWHQIVDKLINMGFEQDEKWDEMCGSPSYHSQFGMTQSSFITIPSSGSNKQSTGTSSNSEYNSETNEHEFKAVHYETYNEPTTLVVLDTTGLDDSPRGIEITDDYTSFGLSIGGKKISEYESSGFINILTLDEYNKLIGRMDKEDLEQMAMAISGFVVPNFKGDIEVYAKNDDSGEFTTNFDFSDYIQYQLGEDDSYHEVGLNFPEGTITFNLNNDLSLPLSVLRDAKIDLVLN